MDWVQGRLTDCLNNNRGLLSIIVGQLRLEASPTRRAMTMAGNRTPTVDKKVASILAEVLTA